MASSISSVTGTSLQVDGLRESMKALKAIDARLPRVVSKTTRTLVKTVMVPPAVANWRSQNIKPSVASQVVKGSGTTTGASLKLVGSRFPFAMGVEFGAKQYPQFRPWRGNQFTVAPGSSTGYVAQDAVRDNLTEFGRKFEADIARDIDKAFKEFGI